MKVNSFTYLISLVVFLLMPAVAKSQFQGDRLSFRVSAGYNFLQSRFSPAALSMAIESRYRHKLWLSSGFRYETGLLGMSENRIVLARGTYRHTDASLSRLNIYSVHGYFHFNFLGAQVQAGPGLEYVRTQPRVVRDYRSSGELSDVTETGAVGLANVNYSVTIDVGRAFMGFRQSRLRHENNEKDRFYNFSLGYCILDDRPFYGKVPKASNIPFFFLEFGMQPMLPFSGEAKASAISAFVEPKFAIAKRLSMGFRFDLGLTRIKGYDNDNEFDLPITTGNPASMLWRQENRMSETTSMLGTVDYYFPTYGGWYFVGAGFGQYMQGELQGYSSGGIFQQSNFPKIPSVENFGVMLRAGLKTSLIRFGINVNFTGSGISDYVGLQVGVEPSFVRKK